MKHAMCDLETLSTKSRPVIAAVGLVLFDEERIIKDLYRRLDIDEQIKRGRHVSDSTIRWWMRQSDQARHSTFEVENLNTGILHNLSMIREWFFDTDDRICVWGNGSDFDNNALMSLFHDFDQVEPWSYHDNRCYRTMKNIPCVQHIEMERVGEHHNALDDARSQALHLQRIFKELNRENRTDRDNTVTGVGELAG
jgi:hypothetical protein